MQQAEAVEAVADIAGVAMEPEESLGAAPRYPLAVKRGVICRYELDILEW